MMKILLLDIETAPNTAYVWGLFKQNISISQIVDSSAMLCWAAKWLDQEDVMFSSIMGGRKKMLQRIHKLLDEADAVVHYNGSRFDIPTLNKEFLEAGMSPPSPYAQIDLLKTARQQFRFPSNKLDYVGRALGLGQKVSHEGFELWIKCMNKDKDAWTRMQAYNVQDVLLLEKVYKRFLPWIKNHPNRGVHMDTDHVCPTCGSHNVQKRGYNHTKAGRYQRYQCRDCATWSAAKGTISESRDTLRHIV
jgi:DNA polymerase elongation subunit (family B)